MTCVTETARTFACFGASCAVRVAAPEPEATAAVATARARLLGWHERFTRFDPHSELSRLNGDPRETVAVSAEMALLAEAVVHAARETGGLVDATLVDEIERAGYRTDLRGSVPLPLALRLAPPRQPAGPRPGAAWHALRVDRAARTITRPPGLRLDSGGLAKGLFADLVAAELAAHDGFVVDCAGDLRLGGVAREVAVADPFGGPPVHVLTVADGAVATSGISRRSWLDAEGRPAHHLLDPATGRPAFTGIVQATALAPTAVQAEIRGKAALLGGPSSAAARLPDGGVLVLDDGRVEIVPHKRAPAPSHDAR